jgi:proteasome lid subunit RPN8/RPN11
MFRVRIKNDTLQKISNYVNKPHEQIGLLIGRFESGELVVNESINGTSEADKTFSVFSQDLLAEVADDILNGRLDGTIVGWYHTHLEGGIFMSSVDINTQRNLQQFSKYVISMIIDTSTHQFGVFVYDAHLGPVQIPSDMIATY